MKKPICLLFSADCLQKLLKLATLSNTGDKEWIFFEVLQQMKQTFA